ncbi:MAG: DNA ligase D [Petrimonas sp.]|nr:DNA ligase D [Petrimonas sp.]
MSLQTYKNKRDFTKTSEPENGDSTSKNGLAFVVQRHAARRLHYDFRLEMNGVLKSWAVPRGPSLNPSDKRLAMMVEDHPYSYITFEGTIPDGNYGAGEVEIWDKGFYRPLNREKGQTDNEILQDELKRGYIKIILHGEKLKGEFALRKMSNNKDENAWLLMKHNDKQAVYEKYDAENETSPSSKVTKLAEKKYKKTSKSGEKQSAKSTVSSISKKGKITDFIKPMLASTAEKPFDGGEWIFEIKWDGYRAIAEVGGELQFYSRNGLSFKGKYPSIELALEKQAHHMILDGEIVAYNKNGKPDFQTLQHFADNPKVPLIYHVFDLLFLNGHSTKDLTLLQRKELLKEALIETPPLKFNDHMENEGRVFYETIQKYDLEGMMAKKKTSAYHEGIRSSEWLKIKNHKTDEAVIAGYTKPRGSRKYFGSLILGKYKEGKLHYAGHAGTGFDKKSLKEIHALLQPLVTEDMPFDAKPIVNTPPTWVKLELVTAIKYSQLTEEGIFRHPVFLGIREDVSAHDLYQDSLSEERQLDRKLVNVDNHSDSENSVKYTNLDKLYWKKEKITKGDLIDYYLSVSDYILPHLKDRAQSLHRFPEGIDGLSFYHKDAGKNAPSWVQTVRIFSESNNKEIEYVICNDKETLGYLINLGCIELNPWNNRIRYPDKPDFMIIDLDPSEKNTFKQVKEVARTVKEVLDWANVPSYCKTSGSTGIHIFVPMGARYEYEQVRDFGNIIARLVNRRLPKTTTLERSLRKRGPKIYLDYLQNRTGQTVASVYSVRPKPGAPVSMPLEWDELTNDLSMNDFSIRNALTRIVKKGDIFLPVLGEGIDLRKALDMIDNEST